MAIPASDIVSITPNVLSAGGTNVALRGLLLSTNTRTPIGTPLDFASAAAVGAFYGDGSDEYAFASKYFLGFDNRNLTPSSLLITQYPASAVAAWLRGASMAAITLATLKTYIGDLSVVIDGYTWGATGIDLSPATSFSAAASIIQTALRTVATGQESVVTGSISGTTLTVTAVTSGTLSVGQVLTNSGNTIASGTTITALGTGTGEMGTYTVSIGQTVSSGSITASDPQPSVTFDSTSQGFVITSGMTGAMSAMAYASGTLATDLLLTSALGATISRGSDATTPAAFMNSVIRKTQNWVSFTTLFDPDSSGNAVKRAFAAWNNSQDRSFAYVAWDTDVTPTESSSAASSLGHILKAANSEGTVLVYAPTADQGTELAAFVMGAVASVDPNEANGRTTLCFRSQSGITASVDDQTIANNLIANGYNYYGVHATRADDYTFFRPGSITGDFAWIDSYINQILIRDLLQVAFMDILTAMKSIPYNADGYALLRAAAKDPATKMVNFGAIRSGVSMSSAQIAEVKAEAGLDISAALYSHGWYLMITDATPSVRAARKSPPMKFWYMDGESVQSVDLTSIEIQ